MYKSLNSSPIIGCYCVGAVPKLRVSCLGCLVGATGYSKDSVDFEAPQGTLRKNSIEFRYLGLCCVNYRGLDPGPQTVDP